MFLYIPLDNPALRLISFLTGLVQVQSIVFICRDVKNIYKYASKALTHDEEISRQRNGTGRGKPF